MIRTLVFLLGLTLLASCGSGSAERAARILAIGDSMMAWNGLIGQSIPDVLAEELDAPVVDRAVTGARMIYRLPVSGAAGFSIPKQYRGGDWDWVIVNGGGNDLWLGCGCAACDRRLDRMITADGTEGEIAELVQRIRKDGARVIYLGYLRVPGRASPISGCREVGDRLDARLAALAEADAGVTFLSLADLVPDGDLSFHALDRVHPSPKASRLIGQRVAETIKAAR